MHPIPRNLANKFAHAFAGKGVGFSAREITDYFSQYSNLVQPYDHYGVNPTRIELFIDSMYALPPKQQYYALNDLAFYEKKSKYAYPRKKIRDELCKHLHCFISPNPIGLSISKIRETAYREDWMVAQSRIEKNPSASITAARTMLETLLKTIISERGQKPDKSGDLNRLVRQAQKLLNFDRKKSPAEHKIAIGLCNIVNGISEISNAAGDRHGIVMGKSIDDPYLARLVLNSAGTLGLMFIEMHLFTRI